MELQFKRELDHYRRRIELSQGVGKEDHLTRDAEWTVRYQKGERVSAIAEGLMAYDDSVQAVRRAIERFAKMIGLTLKTSRRAT
jgi:hypothetical protein